MEITKVGLSSEIRKIATQVYVEPAIRLGRKEFSIRVRDLMNVAEKSGIETKQRTPPFCSAIQKKEFLVANGLEVSRVEGPPSGRGTKVVVHFRVLDPKRMEEEVVVTAETPQARACRLTESIRGLLKEELAEYGGGEAFIRWIRSESGDAK